MGVIDDLVGFMCKQVSVLGAWNHDIDEMRGCGSSGLSAFSWSGISKKVVLSSKRMRAALYENAVKMIHIPLLLRMWKVEADGDYLGSARH